MAGERILIVDHDEAAAGECLQLLSAQNFSAEAAGVGLSLLKMSREAFDLILVELSLPEMSGLKLLQRIESMADGVPVVVMAGPGQLQKAVLALKFGARGFITRPFTPREFSIALQAALKKARPVARAKEDGDLLEVLENAHFEAMKALAQAIEAKDHYTGGHCDRMVKYSVAIASEMGLSQLEKKFLRYAAALHDIGKIGIPESILNKPGKLTPEEYEVMKAHPVKGAAIIRGVSFLAPVVPVIYHHQECYDGRGYPGGLTGEEIPLGSRIVAVLDTFDAMTSDRPYRKALPLERAFEELRRYSNRQFDPFIVDLFLRLWEERSWSLQHFSHGYVPGGEIHPTA